MVTFWTYAGESGTTLNVTNSSFKKVVTFCRSMYAKKVMKLLAFIFEQPSYVCGINLRSESSLVLSEVLSRKIGVPEFASAKSKYDLMRILSFLVRIYTTSIGIHRLLHVILRFFIFFVEQLFFMVNQM